MMQPRYEPVTGALQDLDETSPLFALNHFYRGFNNRDLGVVIDNWAPTNDIAMDNPLGGIRRGWPLIREVYERLFAGTARVYVEFYDYTVHESGDVFYAVGRERGQFVRDDIEVPLEIRTSRIFRRIDDRWYQVHHHGSIDDPALLDRYQRAVRGERLQANLKGELS